MANDAFALPCNYAACASRGRMPLNGERGPGDAAPWICPGEPRFTRRADQARESPATTAARCAGCRERRAVDGARRWATFDGIDVLRPTPPKRAPPATSARHACYPLVPYSNRIAHARLAVGGPRHRARAQLRRPSARDPRRRLAAAVARRGARRDQRAAGARAHGAGAEARAWPWPFRATQSFALAADARRRDADREARARQHRRRAVSVRPRLPSVLPADGDDRARFRRRRRLGERRDAVAGPPRRRCPPAWRHGLARGAPRRHDRQRLHRLERRRDALATRPGRSTSTIAADRAAGFLVVYAPAGPRLRRRRAGDAHDRRVQPRRARRGRHRHPDSCGRRGIFLYDAHLVRARP